MRTPYGLRMLAKARRKYGKPNYPEKSYKEVGRQKIFLEDNQKNVSEDICEETLEKDSEIWESIKKIIREETSPVSYETWIEPCKLISISGDKLVIQVENGFFKEMLERRYCGCFQRAAEIVLSEKVKEVVVSCL